MSFKIFDLSDTNLYFQSPLKERQIQQYILFPHELIVLKLEIFFFN